MAYGGMMVFSGSACPKLAESISHYLGQPLGKVVADRFSDGEVQVEVVVVAPSVSPTVPEIPEVPLSALIIDPAPSRGDKPALMPHKDVETLFHEFGHAVHYLLSDVRYPSQAGTSAKDAAS